MRLVTQFWSQPIARSGSLYGIRRGHTRATPKNTSGTSASHLTQKKMQGRRDMPTIRLRGGTVFRHSI